MKFITQQGSTEIYPTNWQYSVSVSYKKSTHQYVICMEMSYNSITSVSIAL